VSPAARAWVLAGGLCALVVGADQAAKAVVEASLTTGEKVEVLGPVGLTLSHNRGIAFGLAGGAGAPLILIALAALGAIGYLFAREPTRPGMWVAAGLLAGGAIGNLLDRIASDAVTDYIDVGAWPAFNLADVAITCGVLLLVVLSTREAEREAADDG
jgi:signal peptidase II